MKKLYCSQNSVANHTNIANQSSLTNSVKSAVKRISLLIFFLCLGLSMANAQVLYTQDMNFTGALTANGWVAHSGAATNPISTTAGLSYSGHAGSGVGNAALVNNAGGEDINTTFTSQSTNGQSVYVSALINVTDPATAKTGDYFFHIGSFVFIF